jgi:hypothetical protein
MLPFTVLVNKLVWSGTRHYPLAFKVFGSLGTVTRTKAIETLFFPLPYVPARTTALVSDSLIAEPVRLA